MTKEERKELQKLIEKEEPLKEYLEEAKNGGFICPLCKSGTGTHGTGALFYYKRTNTAFCHACGQKISVFDVYMAEHGVSFTDAFEYFADKRGYDVTPRCDSQANHSHLFLMTPTSPDTISSKAKETEAEEKPTANYRTYYEACEKRLTDKRALDYLASRCISYETAKRCHIGFDPKCDPNNAPGGVRRPDKEKFYFYARLVVPCTMAYYETRSIRDLGIYSKRKVSGSHVSLFNIRALKSDGPIFVTEGFFDALSVEEMGYHGVAINGAPNYKTLLERPELRMYHGAFILCAEWDEDEATRTKETGNFKKLDEALREQGYKTKLVYLGGEVHKDANDYLKADREGFRRRLDELAKEVCR